MSKTQRFAGTAASTATSRIARRRRPVRTFTPPPVIELVESRRLLSASASNGVLTVTGSEFDDNILITANSGGQISVTRNNQSEGGPFSGITSIVVNALGGHDQITIRPDGQDTMGTVVGATVNCGEGNDTANGGSGSDVLRGEGGNDELSGKGGDDVMDGGTGADKFFGGHGVDTVDYSSRTASQHVTVTLDNNANDGQSGEGDNVKDTVENLVGGAGNDNFSSPSNSNAFNSFWGNDGHDNLTGGGGDDNLDGGNGHDVIDGGEGNDWVTAGAGYDVLRGGNGADHLEGQDDGDTIEGGLGADLLDGGNGDDVADYQNRTENLSISLDNVANDGVRGGPAYFDPATGRWVLNRGEQDNVKTEHVWAGSGNDSITARAADNVVNIFIGNGGNDFVDGGGGSDYLFGMAGDDILVGNDSVWDNLSGGDGHDLVRADAGDYVRDTEGVWNGFYPIFF